MLKEQRLNYKLHNNFNNEKELIYPLGYRGFFSEINNLALVTLYCLKNEITLKLYSKKWVSGEWKDYYIPLIKEYDGFIPVPIDLYIENRVDKYLKLYHQNYKKRYIIQKSIWNEMRSENFVNQNFSFPNLGINGDIFEAKRQILKLIINYNDLTQQEIKNIDPEIIQSNEVSCGLHIRRGDKVSGTSKEADAFSIETYVNAALEIDPSITTFTLCTDDYSVVKDFKKLYPQYKLVTLCPENRIGYFQKQYNSLKNKPDKRNEVINILKDCDLLIKAKMFVGTYSSNVARYIVLMRNNKECYSIDENWSPF